MSEHECQESYQECMANRAARINRVIAENPGLPQTVLAELAGVTLKTIQRHDAPRYKKDTCPIEVAQFSPEEMAAWRKERPLLCDAKAGPPPEDGTVFAAATAVAEEHGWRRPREAPAETKWWHVPGLLDATPTSVEQVKTQYFAMGWIEAELLEPYHVMTERKGKKLEEAQQFFSTKKAWGSWIKEDLKTCEMTTREVNNALAAVAKAQPADDYIFSLTHDKRVDVLKGIINRRLIPAARTELWEWLADHLEDAAPPVPRNPTDDLPLGVPQRKPVGIEPAPVAI